MAGMTRSDVLRKCIIVFDAIKRAASKGNAGLEPARGAEESFRTDCEICDVLREWLREMEGGQRYMVEKRVRDAAGPLKDWQQVIQENGAPERLDFDKPASSALEAVVFCRDCEYKGNSYKCILDRDLEEYGSHRTEQQDKWFCADGVHK